MRNPPQWSLTREFAAATTQSGELSELRRQLLGAARAKSTPLSGTCAIVGSSGSLLFNRYGQDIDSHHLTIRFNNAPADGRFEQIVGSRTDVRILNSHAAAAVLQRCARFASNGTCEYDEEAPFKTGSSCCPTGLNLLNSGRNRIVECYQSTCGYAPNIKRLLANNSLVVGFQRAAAARCRTKRQCDKSVVSGVYGLAVAQALCVQRVSVYGFTTASTSSNSNNGNHDRASQPQPPVPYHYYDECSSFTADGLNASASSLGALWFDKQHARNKNGRLPRMVLHGATHSHPRFSPPTMETSTQQRQQEPCAARSGVGVLTSILRRAEKREAHVP